MQSVEQSSSRNLTPRKSLLVPPDRASHLKLGPSCAMKIGWSRLASLPCSFSCNFVIHVGWDELNLLRTSASTNINCLPRLAARWRASPCERQRRNDAEPFASRRCSNVRTS